MKRLRESAFVALRLALASFLLLAVLLFGSSPAMAQPDGEWSFREFGYGDLTARTMYGSLDFFFPVPRGRLLKEGSQLKIVFSHSPLLVPDRSTMTVLADGQSLSSIFLTAENGSRDRLIVPLPAQRSEGKGVFVQVQFSLRLTHDECEETQNPALWATVHGDSVVVLRTGLSERSLGLEDLEGLLQPTGPAPKPVALALPADPQPAELEAAGLAAFQFGRWAASAGQDPLIEMTRSPASDRPAIIVGSAPALPQLRPTGSLTTNGQSFSASGGVIPGEHGILALTGTDPPRLLVTGGTPDAVRDAADALARPERRALLIGDHAVLTGVSPSHSLSYPWRDGAASFAQLGVDRRQLMGPGEHILDLSFQRPPGWSLRNGSALELAIEISPALRGETSLATVAVNDREIGTKRLQAPSQRYRFELPADLLDTDLSGRPLRHLVLQVKLYLDIPQIGCTQTSPSSAWASILPTSAWFLVHDTFTGADLGRFPAPLLGGADRPPLNIILPDRPSDSELTAGLQVMAALGRWTVDEVEALPRLSTASNLSEKQRQQGQLILIGGPERNEISAAAALLAPALFEPAVPPEYRLTAGERRGELREAPSPWARDRVALVLRGDDPGGLVLAAEALARWPLLSQLAGRSAAVVDGLPPQTLAAAEPASLPPPSLVPRVETPLVQRLPAWQVVGSVFLGAFVVTLALVVRSRWLRGGHK